MASGKKRGRRGGHPAVQAQRRERDRARHQAPADPLRRIAATICREAAALEDALDAELWASALLGLWWPPPPGVDAADAEDELGAPLVWELARTPRPGAVDALLALGAVAASELGVVALERVNDLLVAGAAKPAWGDAVLEAQVLRTAVVRDDVFDDGITIFVEVAHADGERHAIGVYIDHNLGGLAQDIVLADSIESVEALIAADADEHGALRLDTMSTGEACMRINDAMELTDMMLAAPVSEEYASRRALARLRADDLPGPFPEIAVPEVTAADRDRLLSDFLASPEGDGFAPDGDEAFAVSLAIDFCADYVDGRPLRWSPVLVELFMAGWLPRKVLAERSAFEAVSPAMRAWVRYAGRRRGVPDWAVEQTMEAVDAWTPEMLEEFDAGRSGGAAIDFLSAAKTAGVDVADEHALATFVAGWNARSLRD